MRCTAFFHIWADGHWAKPLAEFQATLHRSGFPGLVHYAAVGDKINAGLVGATVQRPVAWFDGPGTEAPTINLLRDYAQDHEGAILYAHTKGASYNGDEPFRDRWRRSMLHRVVGGWRDNLLRLEAGHDVVGCHWLSEEGYPGMFGPMMPQYGSGFFAGNFWIATTDYLRDLPECPGEPRWEAEAWIGHGDPPPEVVDLLPGWPDDRRWPEQCAS